MGSDEILEYMEENCECCFFYIQFSFPIIWHDSRKLFQYDLLKISIKFQV